MRRRQSPRLDVKSARRRSKVLVWAFIVLVLAATAATLWKSSGRIGFWELLPIGVALLFAVLVYRRAATARKR